MLEPIVQDYLEAAQKLSDDAFCQQLDVPVLVTAVSDLDPSFQSAPTRMLAEEDRLAMLNRVRLDHRSRVLELRPRKPNRLRQVSIGRSESNDLVLADETVSSQHAIYMPDPKTSRPVVQDLQSTNGSRINDHPLLPGRSAFVRDGDTLPFGDAVFLFYSPAGLYDAMWVMLRAGA